jgi:hypothetical protein
MVEDAGSGVWIVEGGHAGLVEDLLPDGDALAAHPAGEQGLAASLA